MAIQHIGLTGCTAIVALILIAVGFGVQTSSDWGCEVNCKVADHSSQGYRYDGSWGTYVSCFILAVLCGVMAALAPGDEYTALVKENFIAGYGFGFVTWLTLGIMHVFFASEGTGNTICWTIAVLLLGFSCVSRSEAAVVAAELSGNCDWMPDPKTTSYIFGALGVIWIILTPVSIFVYKQEWITLIVWMLTLDTVTVITGCIGGQNTFAFGTLITMCGYFLCAFYQPVPFRNSNRFNDDSLLVCAYMLFLGVVYTLLVLLEEEARYGKMYEQAQYEEEEEEDDEETERCAVQ